MARVIIFAFAAAAAVTEAIYAKQLHDQEVGVKFVTIEDSSEFSLRRALEEAIADADVEDQFILIPPGTIPTQALNMLELAIPVVYVYGNGTKEFNHGLPKLFDKSVVTEYLATETDTVSDEELAKALMDAHVASGFHGRPLEVGYRFGNYVLPVTRSNPCINKVLEAFTQSGHKRYIAATPEGWSAIEPVLKELLSV